MKPKKMMLLLAVLAMASWSFVETETPKPNLKQYDAQIVLEWNQIAYESIGENYQHSLFFTRDNAWFSFSSSICFLLAQVLIRMV